MCVCVCVCVCVRAHACVCVCVSVCVYVKSACVKSRFMMCELLLMCLSKCMYIFKHFM